METGNNINNISHELKNYLSYSNVKLIIANYIHCPANWRDIDYIPDYNKFYFICDGEGWLKIGDKEFFPKVGQLFFMPAGIRQSYSAISKNTFKKYWCHFTAKIGDVNLCDFIKLPFFIDVTDRMKVKALFDELVSYYKSEKITSPLRAQSALIDIFAYYIDNIPEKNLHLSPSSSVEKISCLLRYIENNISMDLTVEKLAGIVGFHPNYFIRFFKKHMGSSPINYINKIKIEKAKELLSIKDDMNITEIAYLIGFNNLYHFSKVFKKYTGFSPSEFRNILKNKCDRR
jgi:AraC family transcriptional regulator of arabinose operon